MRPGRCSVTAVRCADSKPSTISGSALGVSAGTAIRLSAWTPSDVARSFRMPFDTDQGASGVTPAQTAQPSPQVCLQRAEAHSFVAENLYNRKVDECKHALWLVSWWQGFEPLHGLDPSQLPSE